MLEKNYGNSCSLLKHASLSGYNELFLFQVVQQPSGGSADQVTTISHSSPLTTQKCGPKMLANTIVPTTSIIKQITLPGNKLLSLQAHTSIHNNKIKENGATRFRGEDDINDVTCMAEVNLDEENACILATHSKLVGTLIQSCKEEPFLFTGALQKRILDIGKYRIMIIDLICMFVEEKCYLKMWPNSSR